MISQILKTILAGVLAGVALFMMPFIIIKVFIFFLLIKAVFRLMGGRRRHHWQYAYAHKYKNMSEEERKAFMQKYGNRCGWNSKYANDGCEPQQEEKTTGV
ncbi:MAG: hypothetical protein H0U95_03080 [Bacteroidetes bacterium]|nr:hypothetical protein [Bacteroidota bacterium]